MATAVAQNGRRPSIAFLADTAAAQINRPLRELPYRENPNAVATDAERGAVRARAVSGDREPVSRNIVDKWIAQPGRGALGAKLFGRRGSMGPGPAIGPPPPSCSALLQPQELYKARPPVPGIAFIVDSQRIDLRPSQAKTAVAVDMPLGTERRQTGRNPFTGFDHGPGRLHGNGVRRRCPIGQRDRNIHLHPEAGSAPDANAKLRRLRRQKINRAHVYDAWGRTMTRAASTMAGAAAT